MKLLVSVSLTSMALVTLCLDRWVDPSRPIEPPDTAFLARVIQEDGQRGERMPAYDEIGAHLSQLCSEHVWDAEQAAKWLIEHRDQSEPRLRALVREGSTGNARLALPTLALMGSVESVLVLEDVLTHGPEGPSWYAGQALAIHPRVEARGALTRAMQAAEPRVRSAAIDAFADRSSQWGCPNLVTALDDPDPDVRQHALRSIARVGCAAREVMKRLAESDPDESVRKTCVEVLDQLPE